MKILYVSLLAATAIFFDQRYYGSTTAPVIIAGGIIKAKEVESIQKKYKRSQCPVCKGKGWYISGDKIKKVDCGYCEPDNKSDQLSKPNTIIYRR